jgi:CHAD domain-containing protein
MARRLTDKSLNDSTLREYFRDDVLQMLEWVSQSGDPTAIHRVRRALKRSRALIQLLQPQTDHIAYRQQLNQFRDIGRGLAASRDAHVLMKNWQMVCSETGIAESVIPSPISPDEQPETELTARTMDDTIRQLLAVLFVIPDWNFPKLSRKQIYRRILKHYEKGRQRFDYCRKFPNIPEGFHDLRKSAKQWYYHTKYLSYFWKNPRSLAKNLKRLETVLGEAHDLYVLEHYLRANLIDSSQNQDLEPAFEFIRIRQSALESTGLERAKDLYDLPANRFVKRHLKT